MLCKVLSSLSVFLRALRASVMKFLPYMFDGCRSSHRSLARSRLPYDTTRIVTNPVAI